MSPRLPPAVTSALAVAPAWNQRMAMSSRNVTPAVSRMPVAMARRRSIRKVRSVTAAVDIGLQPTTRPGLLLRCGSLVRSGRPDLVGQPLGAFQQVLADLHDALEVA